MAGSGWDPNGIDTSITISGDEQTATRVGGNNDTFCVRGIAGRSRGRRYFEITPGAVGFNSYVGAGFMDNAASLGPHTLGSGTPIQGGWRAASGQFTYSYASGSGARADGPNEGIGVLGVLIDFDAKVCEIYKDGAVKFTEVMDIPDDTVLFPACGLYDNNTEATLNTVEPFQFPPQETFIAWDKPDSALASKVSGILQIEGAAAARILKAFTLERLTYTVDGNTIQESKPLGETVSDPVSGEYEIILRDGFPREVFVVAFDKYGEVFEPDALVEPGDRIHPTTPNGYVYECNGSGQLPSTEPAWPTDDTQGHSIGTASFLVKAFYRPMVHGPVTPVVTIVEPDDPNLASAKFWRIFITGTFSPQSTFSTSVARIRFKDAGGAEIATVDGTAIASSEHTSSANKAVVAFNDTGDAWVPSSGEALPQWIGYEFVSSKEVSEVVIESTNDSFYNDRHPTDFEIQYSEDGINWTTALEVIGESEWGSQEIRPYVI
ncbi:MAG TPA: discoidin domain-containing protein [Marinobacter sp.]|uniref:discoidin domain-containing protein n=1 Tax=Marinobacter sp. TaxID=50741 RepID=UPI002D7F3673|nr:discoidin domain-containing protein [Marinobacter sp.]HET8799618.1 discoidin domain-containing protein [Marinobacter sp.]